MKTTTPNKGSKLTRFIMILLLAILGPMAKAQCTANYTYTVDTSGTGDVSFVNTSSTGTGLYYTWDFGDGTTSTAFNPGTHNYAFTGTYVACLTINDSLGLYDSTLGCWNRYCSSFTVTNTAGGPICHAQFTSYDSAGTVYFLNSSVGTGITSSWDFGDGTSGTSTGDITHTYSSPGTYMACLTITNFMGTCTSNYCDTVYYNIGTSGACMGVVNANYIASDSAGTVTFTNSVSGTGPVYFWDFGDGSNSSVVGSTTHTYSSPGNYLVCLTVYETGGSYDSCQYCSYVTVSSPPPACNAYFVVQQDSTNLYNYFIYNYGTVMGGTISYLWDFGDGTTSTLAFPSHTYTTTTPVLICLTVSDGLGCTSNYCDSIVPGHGMSSGWGLTVLPAPAGIQELSGLVSVTNYPNPLSDNTTIEYSLGKDADVLITITDLLGNNIAQLENSRQPAGEHKLDWNASGTAAGMYLLRMKVNNSISTKKLMINR